jgi:hypothetical protein
LELDLAQLSSPPGEAGYGTNYRVLGAELERELDQCLDERASLLAAFDGRDADGASSEIPQVIDQASVLQQYVIESILSADEALRYDPTTESFYRITLNTELDSHSATPAIGNHLHQVPSVYESMLLGFLTAAIMSQRVAEVKTEADEEN